MFHRTLIAPLTLAALVLAPAGSLGASSTTYRATLKASNEVPEPASSATGSATFTVAANGKSISYSLKGKNLKGRPAAAHLHFGKAGTNGPVVLLLKGKAFTLPASGKVTSKQFSPGGGITSFAGAVKALKAGKLYVNIHTTTFTGGELRGQVKKL